MTSLETATDNLVARAVADITNCFDELGDGSYTKNNLNLNVRHALKVVTVTSDEKVFYDSIVYQFLPFLPSTPIETPTEIVGEYLTAVYCCS